MPTSRIYRKNFLTNVVLRVDYYPILELREQMPTKFQEMMSKNGFPIVEDFVEHHEGNQVKCWVFKSKTKDRIVVISAQYISLEYLKYKHFEEFMTEGKLVLDALAAIYPVRITKRIGLRYINQIKVEEGDCLAWDGTINKELGAIPTSVAEGTKILRLMHSMDLKIDEFKLRFKYGLFNSIYPEPITKKEFVLDYDCSTTEEHEISEVLEKAKEAHVIVHEWFEKSIGEGLRTTMGVGEDGRE